MVIYNYLFSTKTSKEIFDDIIEDLDTQNALAFINDEYYQDEIELTEISQQEIDIISVDETIKQPVIKELNKSVSKGEQICKQSLEKMFGKKFITVRPDFLKNPETSRNLELDCYNEELKLAVEYNGIQHYNWPNFTNQTQEQFINQIRRDKFKLEVCDDNGIYLIIVPYTIKHDDIYDYILERIPYTLTSKLKV